MKYPSPQKLSDIAAIINARYVGGSDFEVSGQNEIHVVQKGDIVFVDHPKYYEKALKSNASVILINKEVDCPPGKALLIHDDPFSAFNQLTKHFNPFIPPTAQVDKNTRIGEGTVISPGVFIGPEVSIGNNCIIHPNATITGHTVIGNNVEIHPGVVLGSHGFYYKRRETGYDKLLTGGRVVIEDHVEIGAGSTIDRGVSGDTTIKKGTKIDNLCHVAHDTVIGEKCLIAAHTGIAGCTVLEDDVILWGRVGVKSGITIGKGAVVMANSGVSKSLEGGKEYFGLIAVEAGKKFREMATIRQLANPRKK